MFSEFKNVIISGRPVGHLDTKERHLDTKKDVPPPQKKTMKN